MRSVRITCKLMGATRGDTPNRTPGTWDGSGDRILIREMDVDDASRVVDAEWEYAMGPGEDLRVYEALLGVGYVEQL